MKKVTIYSTPTCTYCNMTKQFFKDNNIQYEEFNVASDAIRRQEMIDKSGQMGIPVIFVDSELTIGFDKNRLATLLNLK